LFPRGLQCPSHKKGHGRERGAPNTHPTSVAEKKTGGKKGPGCKKKLNQLEKKKRGVCEEERLMRKEKRVCMGGSPNRAGLQRGEPGQPFPEEKPPWKKGETTSREKEAIHSKDYCGYHPTKENMRKGLRLKRGSLPFYCERSCPKSKKIRGLLGRNTQRRGDLAPPGKKLKQDLGGGRKCQKRTGGDLPLKTGTQG